MLYKYFYLFHSTITSTSPTSSFQYFQDSQIFAPITLKNDHFFIPHSILNIFNIFKILLKILKKLRILSPALPLTFLIFSKFLKKKSNANNERKLEQKGIF